MSLLHQAPGGNRLLRVAAILLVVAALASGVSMVQWLPGAPDLYVHLLWAHQVMRCLSEGALPLWLPDLNAGFGSPGIRLYSPLGPTLSGALGLVAGSAGSGLRAAAVLSTSLLAVLLWRRRGVRGLAEAGVISISPLVLHSLLHRGAWSEFLALPLIWWLLESALTGTVSVARDGAILALLWLLHSPSTALVVVLMAFATAMSRDLGLAGRLLGAGVTAAGLSAWQWLPLASEMALVGNREALTGGIFSAELNVLGSQRAHDLEASIWLGWCAVGLLLAVLVGKWWRREPRRTLLIGVCVWLASPLSGWVWRLGSPLAFIQFPWRWLLPAFVLAAAPACARAKSWSGKVALAAALGPAAVLPLSRAVHDPGLTATMGWQPAGRAVLAAFRGNPFVVDAAQNRPASWRFLGSNLRRFGPELVFIEPATGTWRVERWRPLERTVSLDLAASSRVSLRLLDYPFWMVTVDGATTASRGAPGVVGAVVSPGRHTLRAFWVGDPLAQVGVTVALGTGAILVVLAWRRRVT